MLKKQCKECGQNFSPRRYDADFCKVQCRSDFNNRRRDRGAELYDYEMIIRHEPELASRFNLAQKRVDLIGEWQAEDERAGRKRSWKRPDAVLRGA